MEDSRFFFVNEQEDIFVSYRELLRDLENREKYSPVLLSNNTYDILINLILGLCNDLPVTLIDTDVTNAGIEKLGVKEFNVYDEIPRQTFTTVTSLVHKLKKSKSDIFIYSSGTSGVPKKIKHNVQRFVQGVRIGEKYFNDVWALAFSYTHMAGIQVFFQAILNGNSLINVFKFPKKQIIEQLDKHKVTHLSATTTFYRLLQPNDFSVDSVVRITIGGEKSSQVIYKFITSVFPNAKINNIYASTEAGTILVSNGAIFTVPTDKREKVIVVDNELVIHKTLLGDFDAQVGEWYSTGDIVEVICKEPLELKFLSRKTSSINVGGLNVFPSEVEDVLMKIDGVLDARVFSKKNALIGNLLVAEIVAPTIDKEAKKGIREYLETQLQSHQIPRIINVVDKLELTRTGKKLIN